jgi:hypothetical protein
MSRDWKERDDEVAGGANCPMPDCAGLAVSYRRSDEVAPEEAEPWEFTCPPCGIDFTVSDANLVFHSVPKDWLLAKVHVA